MALRAKAKVVFIGDTNAGKTSLINRVINDNFNRLSESTIGCSYRTYEQNGVRLGIWDTAGQEQFRNIIPGYIRGADALVLCMEDPTIEQIEEQLSIAEDNNPRVPVFLVATKMDLAMEHVYPDIERFCHLSTNVKGLYYTSARTDTGVNELMTDLVEEMSKVERVDGVIVELVDPGGVKCCVVM